MATTITHLALLEYLFDTQTLSADFIPAAIGTLFPDIRYLASVPREKLHRSRVRASDVTGETDGFQLGMLLHSYIDLLRDAYWLESGLYHHFAERSVISALKYVEDELFYFDLRRGGAYRKCVSAVVPSCDEYRIDASIVRKWNECCFRYASTAPSDETREELLLTVAFSREGINYLNRLIAKVKAHPQAYKMVREFHTTFPALLRESLLTGREAQCDYGAFDRIGFSAP